tara:strand:- start:1893 stop:2255 length:363 start_codon:yes stop_codon:yes gene_type:complete
MKSLFPNSSNVVEKLRLGEDRTVDVYVWTSPEGVKIATHMIFGCPSCNYPLSLASSEFDFEELTLSHVIKCPSRWKKCTSTIVEGKSLSLAELNEKGKPIIQRCGWSGYIVEGRVVFIEK